MLERLEGPENVIAVRAVGKVEDTDYAAVLEPAVKAAAAERQEIRLVYVLGEEFDSYTLGASWYDMKLGVGHWTDWKRLALVTDHEWLRRSVSLLGWMMPGEVRVFGVDEQGDAMTWAAS